MSKAVFKIDEVGSVTMFAEHTEQQAATRDVWKNNGVTRDDSRQQPRDHDGTIEWSDPNFWGR